MFTILAFAHGKHKKADNIKVVRLLLFGIWTTDFVSDMCFVVVLLLSPSIYLWIYGIIFTVLPWVLNLRQLSKYESIWCNDADIKFTVARWLLKNNKKILLLTMLCGSSYAVVEMCNSNAFGMDFIRAVLFCFILYDRDHSACCLFANVL